MVAVKRVSTRLVITRHGLHLGRDGRVRVRLGCPRAHRSRCKGTLRLKVRRSVLGQTRFSIAAGKSQTVRVRLGRTSRARVRRASKGLRVTVVVGSVHRTLP